MITTGIGFLVGFRLHGTASQAILAFLLCLVYGFAFEWVFISLGMLAGTAQAAQGLAFMVFPLTFVSSAYVPVASMPSWLQGFAENQPITVMVNAVRTLTRARRGSAAGAHGRLLRGQVPAVVGGDRRGVRAAGGGPVPPRLSRRTDRIGDDGPGISQGPSSFDCCYPSTVTEVDISGPCTRQTMVYVPGFFARNVKLVVGSVKRPEFRNADGLRSTADPVGLSALLLIVSSSCGERTVVARPSPGARTWER